MDTYVKGLSSIIIFFSVSKERYFEVLKERSSQDIRKWQKILQCYIKLCLIIKLVKYDMIIIKINIKLKNSKHLTWEWLRWVLSKNYQSWWQSLDDSVANIKILNRKVLLIQIIPNVRLSKNWQCHTFHWFSLLRKCKSKAQMNDQLQCDHSYLLCCYTLLCTSLTITISNLLKLFYSLMRDIIQCQILTNENDDSKMRHTKSSLCTWLPVHYGKKMFVQKTDNFSTFFLLRSQQAQSFNAPKRNIALFKFINYKFHTIIRNIYKP